MSVKFALQDKTPSNSDEFTLTSFSDPLSKSDNKPFWKKSNLPVLGINLRQENFPLLRIREEHLNSESTKKIHLEISDIQPKVIEKIKTVWEVIRLFIEDKNPKALSNNNNNASKKFNQEKNLDISIDDWLELNGINQSESWNKKEKQILASLEIFQNFKSKLLASESPNYSLIQTINSHLRPCLEKIKNQAFNQELEVDGMVGHTFKAGPSRVCSNIQTLLWKGIIVSESDSETNQEKTQRNEILIEELGTSLDLLTMKIKKQDELQNRIKRVIQSFIKHHPCRSLALACVRQFDKKKKAITMNYGDTLVGLYKPKIKGFKFNILNCPQEKDKNIEFKKEFVEDKDLILLATDKVYKNIFDLDNQNIEIYPANRFETCMNFPWFPWTEMLAGSVTEIREKIIRRIHQTIKQIINGSSNPNLLSLNFETSVNSIQPFMTSSNNHSTSSKNSFNSEKAEKIIKEDEIQLNKDNEIPVNKHNKVLQLGQRPSLETKGKSKSEENKKLAPYGMKHGGYGFTLISIGKKESSISGIDGNGLSS